MDKMAAHRHGAAQDTQGTDPGAMSTSTTTQDASAERFAQLDTHQDGQLSRSETDSFLQRLKTQLESVGQYEQVAAGASSAAAGSTLHTTA